MDSEGRDTHDGSVDFDELRSKSACLFSYHYSASYGEIAIQPRMPYTPTVSFNTNLEITRLGAFRDRTNLNRL